MKRSGRWALSLALIGLLAITGWRAVVNLQHKKPAVANGSAPLELPIQLAAQEVLTAQPLQLALSVPLNGVVQAVNSAMVKAYVAGELRGLTVREGDSVSKGQQLARVDATEAEARWRQAKQQADASRAQLVIAQRNQDNNAALVQKGFISTTALLTSQANLDSARANLAATQAAADAARKSVTDAVITSPMSGQIAQRFVQNGERVGVEARIVEVVDPGKLEIMAQLAPADSVQVQVGQLAELQVPGAPQDMTAIRAKVVRINPNAQTGSRTVAAYLAVQKDEAAKNNSSQRIPQLRPGLFLQGSILTGNASQLAVPLAAVRTDKPLPYVQVLQAVKPTVAAIAPERTQEISSRTELRVIHKTVELGRQSAHEGATWVQILKGLNAGDRILAGSTGGLREGTLVEESAEPVSSGSR
ncbi:MULTISPECIES: efflux RND transporter periplasmic adaptor subunit [Comamonas]|uniref:efflux RND transporter periplasmic adaptor subunit n=1 Tax=Comamonas TaxID=283 RepID=UPI00050FBD6C|nr:MULTISPECIES: efflux RND transporter periplasmic adaptor subunit [Comamonas]KGG92772.1 secretion protein HlyD [Comamonas thiooxydans]KGG98649.1 secretion protein HlyD [Comamonas thiooxydans]KGH04966.1 secretion protein HlyD [Comamonas thiooxydans]KGH13749.1 secretion protein HlyD [Comamonas thiooxydans]TZG07847.1 efflux RND transporter periplasmic adaptor subunit [Comamonas thiooxydans]